MLKLPATSASAGRETSDSADGVVQTAGAEHDGAAAGEAPQHRHAVPAAGVLDHVVGDRRVAPDDDDRLGWSPRFGRGARRPRLRRPGTVATPRQAVRRRSGPDRRTLWCMMVPAMPVYLDCAATTPLDPRVRAEMLRYLDEDFGNAGSRTHELGPARARPPSNRRATGSPRSSAARRGDVIFTSGATESNNLAILGLAGAAGTGSTSCRRPSSIMPCSSRSRSWAGAGSRSRSSPPDSRGAVDPDAVLGAVRPDTLLVSMMHVNNETGVIQPVAEVADRLERSRRLPARRRGAELCPGDRRAASSAHRSHQRERAQDQRAQGRRRARHAAPRPGASAAAAADVRRRPGARAAPGDDAGAAGRRLRPGRRTGGGGARRARGALPRVPARRCSPGWRRSSRSSTATSRDRSRTSSTCRFRASTRRPPSTRGATWSAISNGAACTSQSYTCSHVLSAMRLPAWRMDGALRFSWCARLARARLARARGRGRSPIDSVEQGRRRRERHATRPCTTAARGSRRICRATGDIRPPTTGSSRSRRESGGSA